MAVTPMDAAVDAQAREDGEEDLLQVPFPKILDEKDEPIQLRIKELTSGQGVALMNLMSRFQRPNTSGLESAKAMGRFARLLVSLVEDEDQRDMIEDGMADGSIDLDDLMAMWSAITEDTTGRPTKSPSDFAASRKASGTSSRAKSVRRVSDSKRST